MSSPSDNLHTLSDQQLNETLAALLPPPEHHWVESRYGPDECAHCGAAKWDDEKECHVRWVWSPSQVLKLLEQAGHFFHSFGPQGHEVEIGEAKDASGVPWAIAPTFGRAAVIALIRAKRRAAQEGATL